MVKVYLAIPYSGMEEESFKVVNEVAAYFLNKGWAVYSPISQGHSIVQKNNVIGSDTREFWAKIEKEFIDWCDVMAMIVMKDNGMELITKSNGCQSEMKMAREADKPIIYTLHDNILKNIEIKF